VSPTGNTANRFGSRKPKLQPNQISDTSNQTNIDGLIPKTPTKDQNQKIMVVNRAEKILIDSISEYCDKLKVSCHEFSNFFKEEQLILKIESILANKGVVS
jgi:hypothetical protein